VKYSAKDSNSSDSRKSEFQDKRWIMVLQISKILKKIMGAYRKVFILTIICAALFACAQFSFFSEATGLSKTPGLVVNLGKLNFHHLDDGSIKIELVSDNPVSNYQIKTIADKTIVQIKGARSALLPSYLVLNSFYVEVETTVKEIDGEPGVELIIIMPRGTTLVATSKLNKMYFLVSFNTKSKTTVPLPINKAKNIPAGNFQPMVKNTVNTSDTGVVTGQVVDVNKASVVGASVFLTNEQGAIQKFVTNLRGEYSFTGLKPGLYTLSATANGFENFELKQIKVVSGQTQRLDIRLDVKFNREEVTVSIDSQIRSGLTTRILRGKDLEMLPDTPGGLEAALRALTLRSGGARGPQILVDGFSGGRLPPKESIREIRINENPFSAEYSQMGLGRIEIFTKPGTDDFHVNGFLNFNDEILNSRNPFSLIRNSFQSRIYGGNISGPLFSKQSSFFLDFERREIDDNALINATILDPQFNIVPLNQSILIPQRQFSISPRFDYQLNQYNTLVGRYFYTSKQSSGDKVGDFSLPERAVNSSFREHGIQLTETWVLNPKAVNETHFQYVNQNHQELGNNALSTIFVPESFIGGGSDFGQSLKKENLLELQNYTTWAIGGHDLKFGLKFRFVGLSTYSNDNFNGTYTFSGGNGPILDNSGLIVPDPVTGLPQSVFITGIERYRRTRQLGSLGFSPSAIRSLGGGPSQFSIASGEPKASVNQYEVGVFVQDDWRIRPNFTLSSGLRYETQNNIGKNFNLAPRVSFAWGLEKDNSDPKTVIRGGIGVFYDQFTEDYTLEAKRYNGVIQQQFIVSDPLILDLYPLTPSVASLTEFALPQTVRRISGDLQVPFTVQTSLSLERQLPYNFSIAASYIKTDTYRALRSRNVNAPLVSGENSTRPFPAIGEIFQYESTGRIKQNQFVVNTVYSGKKFNFYTTYLLTQANGDTEDAGSFPANQYDLTVEYGRSSLDIRHQFYLGGWISAPWGITLNPLIFFRSGAPFNIITGRDTNGDGIYSERPAFATDLTRPSVVSTTFGNWDLDPISGQRLMPRNYGQGPNFFSVNLGISKTFSVLGPDGKNSNSNGKGGKRPLSMTFTVNVENLFNRTNPGLPVGNLSSPIFGRSYVSAGAYGLGNNPGGNRKIEAQISFNF
jgi:hypothetical protein